MKKYGLIGYPLGHSFSASFFAEKFQRETITDCSYLNYPIESIGLLPEVLYTNPDLRGFNVTIPYKEQILPYLDAISPDAQQIAAVNCVRIENGKLTGYNTDVYGFRESLLELIGKARPKTLVLGSGGASKAICYVLNQLGIDYKIVSRTNGADKISYRDVGEEIMVNRQLIINTTPLGTFPDINSAPDLPYEYLTENHYLFDVVYNPSVSKFLAFGKVKGASIMNGYKMLVGQAEKSWEIWTKK